MVFELFLKFVLISVLKGEKCCFHRILYLHMQLYLVISRIYILPLSKIRTKTCISHLFKLIDLEMWTKAVGFEFWHMPNQ